MPDTNAAIRERLEYGLEHLRCATEQLASAMSRLEEIDVRRATRRHPALRTLLTRCHNIVAQIAFTISVAERTESLMRLSDSLGASLSVDEQYLFDGDADAAEGENGEEESRHLNWQDIHEMASFRRRGLARRIGTVNPRHRVQVLANALDRRAAFDRLMVAIDEVSSDLKDVRYLELCNAAKACFDTCTSDRDTLLVDDLMNEWVAPPDSLLSSA